jgi:small subunit ribosomal protein S11
MSDAALSEVKQVDSPVEAIADSAKEAKSSKGSKGKKKKRQFTDAVMHVQATFNNTIITISDTKGDVIAWATAGGCGFRGARKSTPHAGEEAAQMALRVAVEQGVRVLTIRVNGIGPGREGALRAVSSGSGGVMFKVTEIIDETGVPHNGCRPSKARRV